MIIISLLTSAVFAQNCISLKESKNCKNLENFAVFPSEEFSDVASLDKFLDEGKFSQETFLPLFKSSFDCPNFEGRGGRYGMSTYCAFLVSASKSACEKQYEPNATPLTLCSSTCQAHMDAIKGIFSNSTLCNASPSSAADGQRKTTIQPSQSPPNIAQFCNDLQSNAAALNATSCLVSVAEESKNCGFLFAEETKLHCEKSPSDPCCAAAQESSSVLNPVNNTFVIAGIVAAVLIFFGIVYIVFQRMSKSSQRPTTAYEPERQSKFQSYFKSSDSAPPLPTTMNVGPEGNRRSSLFTTIRASQVLRPGEAPPIPNLPSQFDQSQYGEDAGGEGFKVQVVEDYDAGMEDEISCNVGDIIIVKEEYDDGWAVGYNITSGESGVFPMAICEDLGASVSSRVGRPRSELSARTQSLLPQARY